MRLFIAVELDEKVRKEALKEMDYLRPKGIDVAFTAPENLHITMKFLGEVAEQQLEKVKGDLTSTMSGVKQFKVNVKGMGYFGRPEFMKVVWLGMDEGRDELVNIIKSLNKSLSYIGTENRPPHPHITIGRVKTCKNREVLLHEIKSKQDVEIGEMAVKQIKLKKSELTEGGPIYTDLMTLSLKK